MFGLFKKKPKQSDQETLTGFGVLSERIVTAASASTDIECAYYGIAIVVPIITESKRYLNWNVRTHSVFSEYLDAFGKQDLLKIAQMTRRMADALSQERDVQDKGALLQFWFVCADLALTGHTQHSSRSEYQQTPPPSTPPPSQPKKPAEAPRAREEQPAPLTDLAIVLAFVGFLIVSFWAGTNKHSPPANAPSESSTSTPPIGHSFNAHGYCKLCGWERDYVTRTQRPCVP